MSAQATDATMPAASAQRAADSDDTGRARRCVNRSCGRFYNKVSGERRCVSCGRSTKPSLLAPFVVVLRRLR